MKEVKIDIDSEEYNRLSEECQYELRIAKERGKAIYECVKHGWLKPMELEINDFNGTVYCLKCPKTREQTVYEISRDVSDQVEYFLKCILKLNANSAINRLKIQLEGYVSHWVVVDSLLNIIIPESLNKIRDNEGHHRHLQASIFQRLLKNENIK